MMLFFRIFTFLLLLCFFTPSFAAQTDCPYVFYDPFASNKIQTLYSRLDPKSISQHLAFFELYPNTDEGKQCLKHAWKLLIGDEKQDCSLQTTPFSMIGLNSIVHLITKQPGKQLTPFNEKDLNVIENIASSLDNRSLKGYSAKSEVEVLACAPDEIDLTRAVLLTQFGSDASQFNMIRTYEAFVDLMALQIRTKLPKHASPKEKISAINAFVFTEMGFRFPPHSLYSKDIDQYTFLPSVLDGRKGVCLGVSVLYICLAQRLGLKLEMVTPPGHIYVRYRDAQTEINIETTARGIHIDSEDYLTVNTVALQMRNIKEVIGLTHFNHASVFLSESKYHEALKAYEKAQPYLTDDLLLMELMGYQYLLTGNHEKGVALLEKVRQQHPPHTIHRDTMLLDFLNGDVDVEGLKTIFLSVDENRSSVVAKKDALIKTVQKFPKFKTGLFQLATAWLQLHRYQEALEVLERYLDLENKDPTSEYYATILYYERADFNKTIKHYKRLEALLKENNHSPKILKQMRREFNEHLPI